MAIDEAAARPRAPVRAAALADEGAVAVRGGARRRGARAGARADDAREGGPLGADEVDVAGHVRARVLRDRDDVDRRAGYDIARFGMEAFRSSPRQADLLIVSGRVSHKMAAPLRQIYDQMLEPKWVIAMGACASSGGMFNNYAILQCVDKIVPVDIYVPVCPPRPEALMEGIIRLHEAVLAGVPPAYERRRSPRDATAAEACPASSRSREAHGETTVVVERAVDPRRVRRTRATSSASTSSSTSSRPTTSAGRRRASPATSAPPRAATSTCR